MYAALLTIHVLLIRFLVEGLIKQSIDLFGGEQEEGELVEYIVLWLEYITIGVAIVVVAVPEGLPLAVILSLAFSIVRMLKDNNDVKKLASCEIMGGANDICSDKTGTLTLNQMKVTNIWAGEEVSHDGKEGIPIELVPLTDSQLK